MVKFLNLILAFSLSLCSLGQNLSLGIGGRVSNNWVQNQTKFNFDILNGSGDTLKLQTISDNAVSLTNGLSFPIYVRYTSKRNWWAQLNYGYEIWRLGINAESTPTEHYIQTEVEAQINELTGNFSDEALSDLKKIFEENILDDESVDLQSFERVQYNKLSLAFGSSVNRRGIITFYYGAGIDFYTSSTLESYQGLVYDNDEVSLTQHILEAMPKLKSSLIAPSASLGIEKQNIRLGLDFAFFPRPIFGEHNAENDNLPDPDIKANTQLNGFDNQLINNIASAGVSLNYTLFNQNFNQAISADKKNVLDPVVIGRYREKPKLLQYGVSLNFPSFHNSGWSVIDGFEISEEEDLRLDGLLIDNDDHYLSGNLFNESREIEDYIYLEEKDQELLVNNDSIIDTNFVSTTLFFALGNINSIVKSPKLSVFARLNPHELFSADFNLGYQNHTYGIRSYETKSETINGETNTQTRKLVYQENFHELSLGLNAYVQTQINNISRLGCHVGINYNLWFNGNFIKESGGINDSELLEDFHNYNIGKAEEAEEWKTDDINDINADDRDKGVFTKKDYVDFNYGEPSDKPSSYYANFEPYLFNTLARRSYFELRFGIDYYIENLKFNVYAERSILRNRTFYNSLLTVGMGVSLFLN